MGQLVFPGFNFLGDEGDIGCVLLIGAMPVGYFEAALQVLREHCSGRIGLIGFSKGADLALALAVTQGSNVSCKKLEQSNSQVCLPYWKLSLRFKLQFG